MEKYKLWIFVFLISVSSPSMANQFYLGAGLGFVKTNTGISKTTGTADLDEEDTGVKLYAGVQANNNVAVQLHYADLGEASISGNAGDQFGDGSGSLEFFYDDSKIAGEISSLGVSVLLGLDATADINPYVKIGFQRWESEFSFKVPGFLNVSDSDSGTDNFYGVGIDFKLMEGLGLKLEYERYDIDDTDTDFISIGLTYSFNNMD